MSVNRTKPSTLFMPMDTIFPQT